MQQYEFRGFYKKADTWVYGSLLQSEVSANGHANCLIVDRFAEDAELDKWKVDSKSVGMWTGLYDRKSKKIFQGDILNLFTGAKDVVEFKNGAFWLRHRDIALCQWLTKLEDNEFEVLGNIYENQEVLK